MQYPTKRYGNPAVLAHFAQFTSTNDLAKRFRRSERTINNWLTMRQKMPFWVEELLILQEQEKRERARQMNMPYRAPLTLRTTSSKPVELVKPVRVLRNVAVPLEREVMRQETNDIPCFHVARKA